MIGLYNIMYIYAIYVHSFMYVFKFTKMFYYCRLTIALLPELVRTCSLQIALPLTQYCPLHLVLNLSNHPSLPVKLHVDNVLLRSGSPLHLNRFLISK